MSAPASPLLSPAYVADLQLLLGRAMTGPTPIPFWPVLRGPLSTRLDLLAREFPIPGVFLPEEYEGRRRANRLVPRELYWGLALPYRLLPVWALVDIAEEPATHESLQAMETMLLRTYHQVYVHVPLPRDLLSLLDAHRQLHPDHDLVSWLQETQTHILAGTSLGDVVRRRTSSRAAALQEWAVGRWDESATCLAELMVDVFAMCGAARLDVEQAEARASHHGGSTAMALASMRYRWGLATTELLPHLLHPVPLHETDFTLHSRGIIEELARDRTFPPEGLLAHAPEPVIAPDVRPVRLTDLAGVPSTGWATAPRTRAQAVELLRESERAVQTLVGPMAASLGIELRVPDAVLGYAVDRWMRSETDYRGVAESLLAAARRRVMRALELGGSRIVELTPDDLQIPRDKRRDR